jgi:hypothetical protein
MSTADFEIGDRVQINADLRMGDRRTVGMRGEVIKWDVFMMGNSDVPRPSTFLAVRLSTGECLAYAFWSLDKLSAVDLLGEITSNR